MTQTKRVVAVSATEATPKATKKVVKKKKKRRRRKKKNKNKNKKKKGAAKKGVRG